MKNDINNIRILNSNLTQENNEYRNKLYNTNDYDMIKEDMNNLKQNYDKCLHMNQILEKKRKRFRSKKFRTLQRI